MASSQKMVGKMISKMSQMRAVGATTEAKWVPAQVGNYYQITINQCPMVYLPSGIHSPGGRGLGNDYTFPLF